MRTEMQTHTQMRGGDPEEGGRSRHKETDGQRGRAAVGVGMEKRKKKTGEGGRNGEWGDRERSRKTSLRSVFMELCSAGLCTWA